MSISNWEYKVNELTHKKLTQENERVKEKRNTPGPFRNAVTKNADHAMQRTFVPMEDESVRMGIENWGNREKKSKGKCTVRFIRSES